MRPFFSYMGSKWQMAKVYGAPLHDTVVEPFAGSAAYATRWEPEKVILIDKNPKIIKLWKWLIHASEAEISALPIDFKSTDDLDIPDGAKFLIGFWLNRGTSVPHKTRGAWARQYRYSKDCNVWNEYARDRIAAQVCKIRKWKAIHASFERSPKIKATWIIDPPYQFAGSQYAFSTIDYEKLAKFCKRQKGQVIVCENSEARWLPFKQAKEQRGTFGKYRKGKSFECVWLNQ